MFATNININDQNGLKKVDILIISNRGPVLIHVIMVLHVPLLFVYANVLVIKMPWLALTFMGNTIRIRGGRVWSKIFLKPLLNLL